MSQPCSNAEGLWHHLHTNDFDDNQRHHGDATVAMKVANSTSRGNVYRSIGSSDKSNLPMGGAYKTFAI
ncbi:hypothetical protein RRG08_026569 [Elysia crispata]|uniref:Uncharacterized protein n=1 Tax=Elysia crispata TaxID=231223 RepID=A0AAE0Y3X0_9GAST|nr:hypothetical protein RRG08_026569 [Elysia crispata]